MCVGGGPLGPQLLRAGLTRGCLREANSRRDAFLNGWHTVVVEEAGNVIRAEGRFSQLAPSLPPVAPLVGTRHAPALFAVRPANPPWRLGRAVRGPSKGRSGEGYVGGPA